MTKDGYRAIRNIISVCTRLAEIVQELDPGKDMQRIANELADARKLLTNSEAFDR